MARKLRDLSEREILALAISLEEEDDPSPARLFSRDSYVLFFPL